MKLIVGLGNPGPEYAFTPHNAGFLAIDRIAEICSDVSVANRLVSNRRGRALTGKAKLMGHDVLLAKPETFMNLSGLSVKALLDELELGGVVADLLGDRAEAKAVGEAGRRVFEEQQGATQRSVQAVASLIRGEAT